MCEVNCTGMLENSEKKTEETPGGVSRRNEVMKFKTSQALLQP